MIDRGRTGAVGAGGVPTGRGAMAPAGTGRGATVLAVMRPVATGRGSDRVAMDRGSGHAGTGRRSTARGVARRMTARATARVLTAPVPMAHDGSSPVPPVPAAGRNHGGDQGRGMTEAVRAARAVRADRMPGGLPALGRIAVVRGPDRAIDPDRGRGRDRGIGGRTSGTTDPTTNRGGRTTAGRARIEATQTDRDHAPVKVRATDREGEGRPVAGRSEARPALAARARIDPTASARKAGARSNARPSSAPMEVRRGRRRCHLRRRSATTRNLWLAGVRSKRRSSRGARPSVSSSSHSAERPSRRSCSMPRTCGSRSSRSKGAR